MNTQMEECLTNELTIFLGVMRYRVIFLERLS